MCVGEGIDEDAVDGAEDYCDRANAQRKRENSQEREALVSTEALEGKP